jgi:hypothetical protein
MSSAKYLKLCKGEQDCRKAKCPGDHIIEGDEKEYIRYVNAIIYAKALIDSWKNL